MLAAAFGLKIFVQNFEGAFQKFFRSQKHAKFGTTSMKFEVQQRIFFGMNKDIQNR